MQPRSCPATGAPDRRVFCRKYSTCLSLAIWLDWPGFHCSACPDFEPEEMDPGSVLQDGIRCGLLWQWVLDPSLCSSHKRKGHAFEALAKSSGVDIAALLL